MNVRVSVTDSPGPRQLPCGTGTSVPYPASYAGDHWKPWCSSRFPAAFRPLAFASWTILSRWRSPPSLQSAYQDRLTPSWTPARVSAFHTCEMRPAWAPSLSRGRWCPPERPGMSRPAPAVSQRPALLPCSDNPSTGHPQSRDISQGFSYLHPSGLPLARGSPDGTVALRLSPELRTLPLPATHVGAGTDHLDTDQDLHHRHQPNLQRCNHSQRATSRRTPALAGFPPASPAARSRC
jgi:hypothetical protein